MNHVKVTLFKSHRAKKIKFRFERFYYSQLITKNSEFLRLLLGQNRNNSLPFGYKLTRLCFILDFLAVKKTTIRTFKR